MPIHVTIEPDERVNLEHLKNIAIEFCGEAEINEDGLQVFFPKNYDAQQYRRVVEAYFVPPEEAGN